MPKRGFVSSFKATLRFIVLRRWFCQPFVGGHGEPSDAIMLQSVEFCSDSCILLLMKSCIKVNSISRDPIHVLSLHTLNVLMRMIQLYNTEVRKSVL